jgi:dihydroorotase
MREKHDLVIEGAEALVREVGPDGQHRIVQKQLNVGVRGGKISAVTPQALDGTEVIQAKNLCLLPGVIDSQVHFRDPGLTHKEDFSTATQAAALGGITSVFDMPNTKPSATTRELYKEKMSIVSPKAWVNFGLFIGATPNNFSSMAELEKLPGCPGVKIFMGSSTGDLLVPDDESLERVLRYGQRRVIVHSEDEQRLAERKPLAEAAAHPRFHPEWRDVQTAFRSTERLLRLARKTGRPVHVLHVTTAEEMELLQKSKDIATVEVLPQHLTLSAPECYERLGSFAQMNPPIRELRHQEALWKAVLNGTVDILGSDHAPHTREEKAKTYPHCPSGMPGVQTILPLMLNHINQGRLPLEKLVELMCENPRRVFGCMSKGRIEVGLDADFTLVDMKKEKQITNSWIRSKCGWTPYDGMNITGFPVMTIVSGRTVMREDELLGAPSGQPITFV